MLGRKQRSQVACSFPNRYLFCFINKVTSLFAISCILEIILQCKRCPFETQKGIFYKPVCNNLIICLLQIRLGKIFVYSLNIRSSLSVILFLNCLLAFCDCSYMNLSTYESVRLKIPKSAC